MRRVTTAIAAALAAGFILQTQAGAQVAASPFDANRIVCADEGARLIGDLRKEIAAAGQRTWTADQERERLESDLRTVLDDREAGSKFTAIFPDLWKDATDFIQKPELVVAACAVTLADAWDAGVRDVARLKQRWAEARYATYKLPGAAVPSAPATGDDPSASDPVDCVRLEEREEGRNAAFRNTCDFDVYFTYCGINPEADSRIADCHKQQFGLIDVAARGVQGGFTRGADKLYLFECRSPKTPKEVEFAGNGIRGFCR